MVVDYEINSRFHEQIKQLIFSREKRGRDVEQSKYLDKVAAGKIVCSVYNIQHLQYPGEK
jgi:hypothetical protein